MGEKVSCIGMDKISSKHCSNVNTPQYGSPLNMIFCSILSDLLKSF